MADPLEPRCEFCEAVSFAAGLFVGSILLFCLSVFATDPPDEIKHCPVPPESEVVCGYVHDDNPNHAGLYLRGTGCAEYDGGEG